LNFYSGKLGFEIGDEVLEVFWILIVTDGERKCDSVCDVLAENEWDRYCVISDLAFI
jgi:hypothetical protein